MGAFGQQAAHRLWFKAEQLLQVVRQAEEGGGIGRPFAQHGLRLVRVGEVGAQLAPDHPITVLLRILQFQGQQVRDGGFAHAGHPVNRQGACPTANRHTAALPQFLDDCVHLNATRYGVSFQDGRGGAGPAPLQVLEEEVVDDGSCAAAFSVGGEVVLVAARLVEVAGKRRRGRGNGERGRWGKRGRGAAQAKQQGATFCKV